MNIRLIFIGLLINFFLWGAPIDIETAQRVAGNIYIERSNTNSMDGFEIKSIDILDNGSQNLIYIFQLEDDGFIMVSADDKVQPLLAYSFESSLVMDGMPTTLAWMLDSYRGMVYDISRSNQPAVEKVSQEWDKYLTGKNLNIRGRDIVGPLFTSHWNQSAGWNDYGPPADQSCEGDQAPSGCVAVSMASIMHYWQYPTVGSGDNSCYCGGYGTQYADFGEAYYDYAAMGDASTSSDAAAFLVWHAGVAVNMDYDCPGSGAQVSGGYPSALYAMENNFLYRDDIQTRYRSSSSDSQWINYLKTEINENRPMIYVGYNDEGGHAWNCDGYDDDLFHMNWGWGGQSDGWFTVTESGDPDGWGDGSHILTNIQPESLNRPNLKLDNYSAFETAGDGDAVINPGESFDIVIEIENPAPWAAASNIELLISSQDAGVNIDGSTSSIISFETLNPGEMFTNSSMPFIVDLDSDIELGVKTFTLIVMGVGVEGVDDNFYYNEYELDVLVSLNQFGFPVYEASQKTSPLSIDFDNDGEDELIFGDYNGNVHVLNLDGTEIESDIFPFETGNQVWGAISGDDMDGDGLVDIVVVSKSKHLYILDINGVKLDVDSEKFLLGSPALGNLDDDSDLEVVFSGYSSNNLLWALNIDGTNVSGFPVEIGEKVKIGVALADFNGNGKDDIVVCTDSDAIHLFYDDGTEAPGFPYMTSDKMQSAPSILEVDGQKVIFAGSNDDNLYAINEDGTLRFSVSATNNILTSPAFLEFNDAFHVFFSDNSGMLYGVDTDGNALNGWPVDVGEVISKSVAFSDLNNDGNPEVIGVTELTDLVAYNLDGSPHTGFPMNNEFPFTAGPLIMDMDGDGDVEILGGSVNSLVSIDIKSNSSSDGYWNMYRGDNHRTGFYNLDSDDGECGVALGDVSGDGNINILDLVQIANYVLDVSVPQYECAADFTGDGTINILDLVQIANYILDN